MKIQFFNGGLANQAFQYIFTRYYELSHPGEVMFLDDSYFALHTVHNGYELEKVFGIKPRFLSERFDKESWELLLNGRRQGKSVPQILSDGGAEIKMISEAGDGYLEWNPFDGEVMKIPANGYFPEIMDYPGNVYYHGYWINKNFFSRYRDVFLEEFAFPALLDEKNGNFLKKIRETQSVSIHVRRGDYVTLNWAYTADDYRMLTESFLKQAEGSWNLFVFSDDIDWCRRNEEALGFRRFSDITYIDGNVNGSNYIDLLLMSRCKAMILSNSAFCYLAALLNTGRQYVLNPTKREV